jgi:hypothetical protein
VANKQISECKYLYLQVFALVKFLPKKLIGWSQLSGGIKPLLKTRPEPQPELRIQSDFDESSGFTPGP